MHANFSGFEQWSIADAEIVVAELNGVGGHAAPHLWLPLRLNISHKSLGPRDGMDIVSRRRFGERVELHHLQDRVQAQFQIAPGADPLSGRLSAETGPISTSQPTAINILLHKNANELTNYALNLEFALDGVRVAALEPGDTFESRGGMFKGIVC